jgi:hypothetical protein
MIRGDKVTWVPSFDLNRVILGTQITAVVALIVSRKWASKMSVPRSRVGRRQLKAADKREAKKGGAK